MDSPLKIKVKVACASDVGDILMITNIERTKYDSYVGIVPYMDSP